MIDVAITGIGIVSPLGSSVAELSRRVAAGERAPCGDHGTEVGAIPLDALPADRRVRVGRLDRVSRLFLAASFLAIEDAALSLPWRHAERVGLSFGTGLGCLLSDADFYERVVEQGAAAASPRVFAATVSSAAAGEVSIAMGIHGPNATLHMGLAAGLGAIGYGFDLIQLGKADLVLAGGADANGPALVEALRAMRLFKAPDAARPFVDAVPGAWPAEGGVVAVLERGDRARARGARRWGRIEGYAVGFEPTLTTRAPEGHGVIAALRRALGNAGRAGSEIDTVLMSAHGTPLDAVERAACEDALGPVERRVLAPKQALGECFGASGPLAVALAVGLAPPGSTALISALCYSGSIGAMVIHRDEG
jgi:3-oxoacyl-[acyl-carrier-protein] synthase II